MGSTTDHVNDHVNDPGTPLREARQLNEELRRLGEIAAPRRLAGQVMAATGLGDAYAMVESPLGPALVAYTSVGVSALSIDEPAAAFEQAHRARTGRRARPVDALPAPLAAAIAARFDGARRLPALRFDLRGLRPFETAVLETTVTIPRGEVRPYGWVARTIGNPGAVRAVGTALGHNPIPLLIPCHRVVRSDGQVGQYAFGPERKRTVLRLEGLDPDQLDQWAAAGQRYLASRTTRVYCFPTCHHAQRISDQHRLTFRNAADADAAGFRPCRVCQP